MRELTRDQVGDGDEVAHGAAAAGLGLGGLDAAVGEPGVEGVEDAVPMRYPPALSDEGLGSAANATVVRAGYAR
jgi:hypothetical protein